MPIKKTRQKQSILALALDAKCQGPDTTVQEEAGVGIQMTSQMIEAVSYLFHQIFSTYDHSGGNVPVTIERLGR